jgi:hypothetical protein
VHWSPDRFYTFYSGPGVHGAAANTEECSHVGITLLAPDLAAQVDPSVDITGRGPYDVIDYPLDSAQTALAVARARHRLPFTDWEPVPDQVPAICPRRSPGSRTSKDPGPAMGTTRFGSISIAAANCGLLA